MHLLSQREKHLHRCNLPILIISQIATFGSLKLILQRSLRVCHMWSLVTKKLPVFIGFFGRDSFEWLDGKLGASTRGGKCEGSKKCQSSRGWGLGISLDIGHWGSLGSVWQPPRHGLQLARALSVLELDGWSPLEKLLKISPREECHGSEAFRAIWAFGVYDPFPWVSGRWFLCFFFVELYCIGAISEQFPLVPGRSGKQRLLADHLSWCHYAEWRKFTRLEPFLSWWTLEAELQQPNPSCERNVGELDEFLATYPGPGL